MRLNEKKLREEYLEEEKSKLLGIKFKLYVVCPLIILLMALFVDSFFRNNSIFLGIIFFIIIFPCDIIYFFVLINKKEAIKKQIEDNK